MKVAFVEPLGDGSLLTTITPSLAGRLTVNAAYVPVIGQAVTFARIPLIVKPAGMSPPLLILEALQDSHPHPPPSLFPEAHIPLQIIL